MTQEQKDLLIKDLCARLPYGVKMINTDPYDDSHNPILKLSHLSDDGGIGCSIDKGFMTTSLGSIKPYLLPLSSMTDEQKEEYESLCIKKTSECTDLYDIIFPKDYYDTIESIDYLYKNHIDIRGLIEKGLAIDATNLNIY